MTRVIYLLILLTLPLFGLYSQSSIKKVNFKSDILWKERSISVTWDNPEANNVTERQWVQEAITESWQRETNLKFTDWCDYKVLNKNAKQVIRIKIEDDWHGPRVKALGSKIHKLEAGMILNFSFVKWGTGLFPEILPDRKTAIKSIAVHEFGHALGFSHQQDREDCYLCNPSNRSATNDFKNEAYITSRENALWFTPCDPISVMNYCNNQYFNFGKLSSYDIEAGRLLYGTPTTLDTNHTLKLVYNSVLTARPNTQAQSQVIERPGDYKVISKQRWYIVNIYLSTSKNELDKIKEVEYYLDPLSFINSDNITITNKNSSFRYTFYAWGNFIVKANIKYTNGTIVTKEVSLDKIPPITVEIKKLTKQGIRHERKSLTRKGG